MQNGVEPKYVSAMLNEEFAAYNNQEDRLLPDDAEKTTFFAAKSKLNEPAMLEYGLLQPNMSFS